MEVIEFITRQDEAGERLDALIARRVPQLTRSRIQQLMEQGLVQAGGRPAAKSLRAVQDGRVYMLDKALFHYKPNERWAESYETLADILYTE